MFPNRSWDSYQEALGSSGLRNLPDAGANSFLVDIGLIDESGLLTATGSAYFQAQFIRRLEDDADQIVRDALLTNRPVQAILQHQFGVQGADKDSAEAALRFHELDMGLNARTLGSLLTLMARFGLIRYVRGSIDVIESPIEDGTVPSSMFISRDTPFSNGVWLKRALRELRGFVFWLDKNFIPAGLESIWEAADGNKIGRVHILSIPMPASLGRKPKARYLALKTELQSRGIELEWRFIDSTQIRDTHDRWIIGNNMAWNVPDVNTLLSGNNSEISQSSNAGKLVEVFSKYWDLGVAMNEYIPSK
ncbi:MAG: hypothetical protein ABIP50_00515 [Candidatus Saccharimonadales bacterium]